MKRIDAEEWTQALGQSVAGSWRQVALAKRMGVPKALGMTTEQWVNDYLSGYVRLNIADRRQAVAELAAGGMSTRGIAAAIGVNERTVRRDAAFAAGTHSNGVGLAGDGAANAALSIADFYRAQGLAVDLGVIEHRARFEWLTERCETAQKVIDAINSDSPARAHFFRVWSGVVETLAATFPLYAERMLAVLDEIEAVSPGEPVVVAARAQMAETLRLREKLYPHAELHQLPTVDELCDALVRLSA